MALAALVAVVVAVALGVLLSAALRGAAVPDEPDELDEPPARADPASAPPIPRSTTMARLAATSRDL